MGRRHLVLVAALTLLVAAPASADAVDLGAKVNAAMAAVRSMQILFTAGNGASGTASVLPHPERVKVQLSIGGSSLEVYEVDGYDYRSLNGGPWSKSRLRPGNNLFDFARSFDPRATLKTGPDETENGLAFGTFTVDEPAAPAADASPRAAPFACSYDKITYRLHRCSHNGVTMAYGDYDDPKISVELPSAATGETDAPVRGRP